MHRTPRTLRTLRTPRAQPACCAHCARRAHRAHCPHAAHTVHAAHTARTLRALRTPRTQPARRAHCARCARRAHCQHAAHMARAVHAAHTARTLRTLHTLARHTRCTFDTTKQALSRIYFLEPSPPFYGNKLTPHVTRNNKVRGSFLTRTPHSHSLSSLGCPDYPAQGSSTLPASRLPPGSFDCRRRGRETRLSHQPSSSLFSSPAPALLCNLWSLFSPY